MNYHLNFNFVWRYADKLYWGLVLSLQLAAVSILIGCVIGFALAVVYNDGHPWLKRAVSAYVEFVRNVPLLLLIYLVFYGIPSVGGFAFDATESFVLTLSLYAGAYMVEVFRAGLAAVPPGVVDAGKAIGLTAWQRLAYVRFPTMLRIVLPSLSNAFISLFKDTSLASVIAVPELTFGANWIKTNTFRAVEVWIVVAAVYLVVGWMLLAALRLLERVLMPGRRT